MDNAQTSNRSYYTHRANRLNLFAAGLLSLAIGLLCWSGVAGADEAQGKNQLSLEATLLNPSGIMGHHPVYSDSKFEIYRCGRGKSCYTPGASLSYAHRFARHFDLGVLATWDLYKDDPTISHLRISIAPTLVFPVAGDKVELDFGLPLGGFWGRVSVDKPYGIGRYNLYGTSLMFKTGVKVFLGDWGATLDMRFSIDSIPGERGDVGYALCQLFTTSIGIVRRF